MRLFDKTINITSLCIAAPIAALMWLGAWAWYGWQRVRGEL